MKLKSPGSPLNVTLAGLLLLSTIQCQAGNWPQWRGPRGDSTSTETNLPMQWSEGEGIVWKTPLPEWGTSTPAIWGDAIFVTTESDGRLLLLRIDKTTGATVWTRQAGAGTATRKSPDADKRAAKFHDLHNLASPSPVTDGERVIVHFGNGDLASFTFDGEREWHRNLADDFGPYTIWWGHANSPVLHGDLVISICMQDSMEGERDALSPSYLAAHDKRTGKRVWHTMRMTGAQAEECDAYTTPVFYRRGGRDEMIVMGGNQLDAYDPATGRRLWHLPGLVGGRTITGPTIAGDRVFATVGMRGPLHSVKLDAINESSGGKVAAERAVAWKHATSTPDTCCPVVAAGLVFLITDNGIATCLDAGTGKQQWQKRIAGGNHKASPLAAEGKVFFLSRDGMATVVAAAREFDKLAENRLDDEFTASPAVSDGRLYLRGRRALYAIGE